MNFVSYPATSIASRWRPDGQVGTSLSGWAPAQRQAWPQGRRLAQTTTPIGARETPLELTVSVGTALAAVTAGLILAFGSDKGKPTIAWIGVLAATIGGLKLLQTGSKLG